VSYRFFCFHTSKHIIREDARISLQEGGEAILIKIRFVNFEFMVTLRGLNQFHMIYIPAMNLLIM